MLWAWFCAPLESVITKILKYLGYSHIGMNFLPRFKNSFDSTQILNRFNRGWQAVSYTKNFTYRNGLNTKPNFELKWSCKNTEKAYRIFYCVLSYPYINIIWHIGHINTEKNMTDTTALDQTVFPNTTAQYIHFL